MSRRRLPDDPERAAVLAELGAVAREHAARADAGDESAAREMGYVLSTMDSIRLYGLDGLEQIRARRWLRRAEAMRDNAGNGKA